MSRRKKDLEETTPQPPREPYVKLTGSGRFGYHVEVVDPVTSWYDNTPYERYFWWGRDRAEEWGKRKLVKYIARRDHEDYEKIIY